jgi:hypothetical protein
MSNGNGNGGSSSTWLIGGALVLGAGAAFYFLYYKPKQAALAAAPPPPNPQIAQLQAQNQMLAQHLAAARKPPTTGWMASPYPVTPGGQQYFLAAGAPKSVAGAGFMGATTIAMPTALGPVAAPSAQVYQGPGIGNVIGTFDSKSYVSSTGNSTVDPSGAKWIEVLDPSSNNPEGWVVASSLQPIEFATFQPGGGMPPLPSGAVYKGQLYTWSPYPDGKLLADNPSTGSWLGNVGKGNVIVFTPTGKVTLYPNWIFSFSTNQARM